ncbi:MAG: PaaI family thioesterase [Microbacterium sp.]|uniref:PaaI family thioesterase n=2 Tax=Microbacterium sp. TaxID=51671 RepID=UPI001AC06244|nr:PaaI family thioesterase [Microbacterium sp.]MBN9153642.1 PaaI family thioesterase [Microbacterium sp.]MBN9187084.1 PaaI family thioesterase [Microbacterium sp.]MBN9196920.1 PaaI family thioesterase [Microbacterium sp.]
MTESTRTLIWADPLATRDRVAGMSGLEAMRALRDGLIPPPPIAETMNFTLTEADPGRVVFECRPGFEHYNPIGAVHGGLACTLLDTVTGCAGHTTLKAGQGYTSIEISVKYLRPITADGGVLTAVGVVTKPGRRVIFAEGTIIDAQGRLLATASSSLLVL